MPYTLVVVDMQHHFSAARSNRVRSNCLREVRNAIKRNADIIFLEYESCGQTLPSIKRMVKDYPKSYFSTKYHDDGSSNVIKLINEHKLSKKIKAVGVNTDCCVYSTVATLSRHNFKVNVIADACNSDVDHNVGLTDLKNLPGVSLSRY